MACALGVDIGGTKIQFCRIEEDYAATPIARIPTALLRRGTRRFADDLLSLIRAQMPASANAVAVSLNGVIDRGRVPYSSLMGGNVDFHLEEFLQSGLDQHVRVDDDIHAMTVAEARLGNHKKGPIAMLNLGTGIGVGLFDGDRVLRGRFAAGLISELKVYIEAFGDYRSLDRTVCGRGLREMYSSFSGGDAEAITVFERARLGEQAAVQAVDIFTNTLAGVLQMISRFYHPAIIVINGSIKKAAVDYLDRAIQVYERDLEVSFRADVAVSKIEHAAELGTLLGSGGPEDVQ
ncbi:ROK family protein [Rhizobium sp. SYY.PMSO]|uniref:ROK family protein n=1 Tax=Rhizobium sp. SYY.PMSO TaxID=3382192 RepID=UPI003990067A